jgi:hypothetical protein
LQAYFPEAIVTPQESKLALVWNELGSAEVGIAEFGLQQEFMLPLPLSRMDSLIALTATLSELQSGELGFFQVIFQAAQHPWATNILRAVSDAEGKPFFVNRPELFAACKQKLARPLYAVTLRVAAKADSSDRVWEIIREMAGVFHLSAEPHQNELFPLESDDYPLPYQEQDLLLRQSRRSGMLLNSDELLTFVHLPSAAVRSSKLVRERGNSKAAPQVAQRESGVLLGHNEHAGRTADVRLLPDQRVRHMHVIGASGTGKSTLLFNLIRQDIENGQGLAVLDPHGDLVESVLSVVPPERIADVVLVDPSDEGYFVGFNILSAHSDLEKTLLASDLVSVFERLSTSWGDQMSSVLQNAILAFLESEKGGTLSDLRRFLLDSAFRNEFLQTLRDPEVVYYWQRGFPQLSGNKSIGPVLTRLETFLSPKPIRYMVSQPVNRLNFAEIMDSGKIFLAKLPQGQIGRENAYLLGSLFVAKLQQTAMARQSQMQAKRRDFWLYIDEFHHFITPSMAEILTGARKYRLGLVLAHQELRQLQRDDEVASAVLSNSYTRVVFRVGDADARALADGFASFEARDLQNLETGEAICRIERSDFDFNLTIPPPELRDELNAAQIRDQVVAKSRAAYAASRVEVEAQLLKGFAPQQKEAAPPSPQEVLSPPLASTPIAPVVEEQAPFRSEVETATAPGVTQPVAETPQLLPSEPTAEAPTPVAPPVPRTPGKGGQKHKYLQQLIKQWAQGMGYMAEIEQPIAGGQVDVALRKEKRSIACEISVTTFSEHETGNVRKCLDAGFDFIALITPEEKRLAAMKKVITATLTEKEAEKVRFVTPEALFAFIEELDAEDASRNTTVRGYKVKVNHRVVDKTSKADRMKTIAKVLGDSVKRVSRE